MRLGLGLGFQRRAGAGGGGGGSAPVLTLETYAGDDLTLSSDLPGTGFWKWSATSTPLSGPAIEAAPFGTAAFPAGIIAQTIADPGVGTWYLNIVNKNAGGYSNVITVEEIITAPPNTWIEDWSDYVNGNTFTELDAAYTRSNGAVSTTVQTEAGGPAGLGVVVNISSLASHRLTRDDISTALAARTTERVQFLFKIKFTTLANCRAAIGMVSGNSVWGCHVARNGSGWQVYVTNGGDYTSVGAPLTQIVTNQSDGDVFYIRIEIDGANIRGTAWEPPASEGAFSAPVSPGANITVTNCAMAVRTIGDNLNVLGYSVGIGADAPSF